MLTQRVDTTAESPGRRIFDAHFHVIDPRFPIERNMGYLPATFTANDYLVKARQLGIQAGTVVAGSFQGRDDTYILDALEQLGPAFVGVIQMPDNLTDEELIQLDQAGVRAVRFNFVRGGAVTSARLLDVGRRVASVCGWHVELYIDALLLPDLEPALTRLDRVVVDHLGLTEAGMTGLLRHADRGGYIKASGFGRTDFDIEAALRRVFRVNPNTLVFGTDLPSTRAPRPFHRSDIELIAQALGERATATVLWDNAIQLYRPSRLSSKEDPQ